MYLPRKFELPDSDIPATLAQGVFAHLVTHHSTGLIVTPLPLLYNERGHSMLGHVARANPHWRARGAESVAILAGLQTYVSPGFYATKAETGKVVPTWNYEVLNIYGRLMVHDDPEWVLELVTALTNHYERDRLTPWQVSDAPQSYTRAQLRAIVGVELVISRIEGKAKMSQNQPARNRAGVVAGLNESGDAMAQRVADRVTTLGDAPDRGSTNANGRG